jgi:hypothetical protein
LKKPAGTASGREAVLVLGNENLKLAAFARLENRVIHAPWFSLPNQPMSNENPAQLLQDAGIAAGKAGPGGLEAVYRQR